MHRPDPVVAVPTARLGLRARVTVGEPAGEWGPWQEANRNLFRLLSAFVTDEGDPITRDFVARDGTALNGKNVYYNGDTFNFIGIWGDAEGGVPSVLLGYGNGAAAPARDDNEISGFIADTQVSDAVTDDAAGTHRLTGAHTYTGPGTTITRAGLYWLLDGGPPYYVLFDHGTVPDTAVTTDEVVTVEYEVAW